MNENKDLYYSVYKKQYKNAIQYLVNNDLKNAEKLFSSAIMSLMKCISEVEEINRSKYMRLADDVYDYLYMIRKEKSNKNKDNKSLAIGDNEDKNEASSYLMESNVKFDDVVGLEDVKSNVRNMIIYPIQFKEIYSTFKRSSGGGILLYGVPGTGKTMIAKAIANEINAKLYFVKCSDIASKWFGESERKVKDLFNEARKNERAVIFFDEFEALGIDRDANDSPCKRIVCELLAQLNGFDKGESTLLVIAATNRPWEIDSALLRNGRISTHICVPLPDYESRMLILNKELENVPLDNSFSFDRLTKLTEGFSGADIVEVTNKLKDLAINRSIEAKAISSINNRDIDYIEPMIKSSVSKKDLDKIETFKTN